MLRMQGIRLEVHHHNVSQLGYIVISFLQHFFFFNLGLMLILASQKLIKTIKTL